MCVIMRKAQVKFSLERVIKAKRGVEVQLYSFLNIGCRWRWVVNAALRSLHPRKGDPEPTIQEVWWAPEPVRAGAENLALPGFDLWTVQPVASRYTVLRNFINSS